MSRQFSVIPLTEKTCTRCGITAPLTRFYKQPRGAGGVTAMCAGCHAQIGSLYRRNNPGEVRARKQKWRINNREREIGINAELRRKYPDRYRAYAKKWRDANPQKANAQHTFRLARKLLATPKWANTFFINEIYDLATLRTNITGMTWHVDHIVPLRGRLVSGLHVENNLRVIPGRINASKGNRYWPDMPS